MKVLRDISFCSVYPIKHSMSVQTVVPPHCHWDMTMFKELHASFPYPRCHSLERFRPCLIEYHRYIHSLRRRHAPTVSPVNYKRRDLVTINPNPNPTYPDHTCSDVIVRLMNSTQRRW
jgi:hypothetical protein